MKIADVETIVLDTGKDYPDPSQAAEAHGEGIPVACVAAVAELREAPDPEHRLDRPGQAWPGWLESCAGDRRTCPTSPRWI